MKHRPVNTKLLTEKGFRGAENNKKIIIIITPIFAQCLTVIGI